MTAIIETIYAGEDASFTLQVTSATGARINMNTVVGWNAFFALEGSELAIKTLAADEITISADGDLVISLTDTETAALDIKDYKPWVKVVDAEGAETVVVSGSPIFRITDNPLKTS